MKILREILEQLKQINEKLSYYSVIHTSDSIKPGDVYCNDPTDYQERFQAKMHL